MNEKEVAAFTDQELREEIKKFKPAPLLDAFFIGFLVGIVIFSVVVNTWGFLTLIPLGLIYRVLKKPKQYEVLTRELKKRGLQ